MVDVKNFKSRIKLLISQDYKIEFLGKNFDHIVKLLTDIKAEKIYRWVENVTKNKV